MIKAGRLTPKMMSKKQRQQVLVQSIKMPKYLREEIMRNDTECKREFNLLAFGMVKGKIEFDIDRLERVKDEIMKGR